MLVDRYDQAKASWEEYGDAGPPIGSHVETLAKLEEFVFLEEDSSMFYLKCGQRISAVPKSQWWLFFKVKD